MWFYVFKRSRFYQGNYHELLLSKIRHWKIILKRPSVISPWMKYLLSQISLFKNPHDIAVDHRPRMTRKYLNFSLNLMFIQSWFMSPVHSPYKGPVIRKVFPGNDVVKCHYRYVIMGAMAYQITSLMIVYLTVYSGADKKNIKAPRHWHLCGEFTGHRWIPRTNGHYRGKCFHLVTSSYMGASLAIHQK